ncbi:MAG: hypothetical protein GFH27_549291n253 [Chloroflexi bacterium AL-W]|nr:hypothetical protein [Chloroflexi bacterium AL-N1]NOK67279.1 hypothetical protein [Chloroflexi bacterium AL-N10]NOK75227.1 hypothetical protein [Chloroflexi bacterium AL-N5]NOK82015.1 hypothetical protein [Chloroflexi bacterium AL-W]NOK89860.1 hypothetical protein [Chloroflexi bacterium AL-N15]
MGRSTTSGTPDRGTGTHGSSIRWWRQTAEPAMLTGLVFVFFTVVLLMIAGWLSVEHGLRVVVGVFWGAGALLLTRLPLFLRQGRRQLVATAGMVIVALGTILVMTPGTTTLAISSLNDRSSVEAFEPQVTTFEQLESMLAVDETQRATSSVLQQAGSLTFQAPPRISRQTFTQVLQSNSSPAAPHANELYDIFVEYGLDPAVALAFFAHESSFCKAGVCIDHDTKSWGNMRAAYNRTRIVGVAPGPFVRYRSWQDGARDWSELILYRYVNRGLDTVAKAVPVYAPASDNNVPSAYIRSVNGMVARWQGVSPTVSNVDLAPYYSQSLDVALVMETFRANELEYYPEWAFHKYMLDESRADRPLGTPIDKSRIITVGDKQFAVQAFALDTLYTPLAEEESETNWSDVRRLSDLLKQTPARDQDEDAKESEEADAKTEEKATTKTEEKSTSDKADESD